MTFESSCSKNAPSNLRSPGAFFEQLDFDLTHLDIPIREGELACHDLLVSIKYFEYQNL